MAEATQAHGADLHGHGGGHAHPANLQHHFETPAQQFDASKLGMWLFLATEVLFFSGLFCAYVIYRRSNPEIFDAGHQYLDPIMGGVNTVVLILSSFTMALGVWCAQKSKRIGLIICLALTLAGACGFMIIKYFEYSHKIKYGLNWGRYFKPEGKYAAAAPAGAMVYADTEPDAAAANDADPAETSSDAAATDGNGADPASPGLVIERTTIATPPPGPSGLRPGAADGMTPEEHAAHARNLHIFFSIYYGMTGLHGLHVIGGIVVLAWLLWGAIKGRYNEKYYTPVDLVGLYWHLVDLVWIFLFPMLYLIE